MTFNIFLASDIHGSDKCYKKFLNAPSFYHAQVLVLCGDLTGKALVFLIQERDGSYWCDFFGEELRLENKDKMMELKKKIDDSGYYSYVCERSEFEAELGHNKIAQDRLLHELIKNRMAEWVEMADKRLSGKDVELYMLPGNDDPFNVDEVFEGNHVAKNPEGAVLEIREGHEMLATGYVNMTPWKAPRDIPDEELMVKLQGMASQLRHPARAIFTLHPPPYNTNLDLAPALEDFKPKTVLGQMEFEHVGSRSVRKIIEEYQPLTSLHGHVHESKAMSKIGRTLCFNAGSEYENGILRGVLLTVSENKVENYFFTAG
ncbi:MAG: metallophosphoesterase [Nitrososphaerota archaeon]|nr:metallophosphoesterase [Nitrososphaerota archaeon]